MRKSDLFIRILRSFLPSPFTLALLLSLLTFIGALLWTRPPELSYLSYTGELALIWEKGIWNAGFLKFAVQMMLMLVLGHVLALTPTVTKLIDYLASKADNTARAAVLIGVSTVLVSLFNWGLGLIFGAILVRKVGEYANRNNRLVNYGLLGAAGYSGLMVWHGGLSGSSLSKVADPGHLRQLFEDAPNLQHQLPEQLDYSTTVFSNMNGVASLLLVVLIPVLLWFMAKRKPQDSLKLPSPSTPAAATPNSEQIGLEKLDETPIFIRAVGLLILLVVVYKTSTYSNAIKAINPDFINLSLLGLCFLLFSSIRAFSNGVQQAISGVSGILLQFPLYAGIMALLANSGLLDQIALGFVELAQYASNPALVHPILTFFSAGLVNFFVPSGGGQWAIQGPVVIQGALELHVPLNKSVLALAYGDQITNMMQPFWAIPLLSITQLKAKDILPYCLILMLLGTGIFISVLCCF